MSVFLALVAATGCTRMVGESALLAEEALADEAFVVEVLPGMEATVVARLEGTHAIVDFLLARGFPEAYAREVASGYSAAGAALVRATRPLSLQRLWGGTSKELGRWYFDGGLGSAAERLALPPGNGSDRLLVAEIPSGSQLLAGQVAPNFGRAGGGTQLFALDPAPFTPQMRWLAEGGPTLRQLLRAAGWRAAVKHTLLGAGLGATVAGGTILYLQRRPAATPFKPAVPPSKP